MRKTPGIFIYLEKINNELNSVLKLGIIGDMSEDLIKMSNHISTFYQKLYSKEDGEGNIILFLESIKTDAKRTDQDCMMLCDKAISIEKVKFGISKLKDNTSLGNDGFVSKFSKGFQEKLSEFLLCVFNIAIECGELHPSLCQGLISLIPKANKDTTLIDNWRPITLLNNYVKVFAIIFAGR